MVDSVSNPGTVIDEPARRGRGSSGKRAGCDGSELPHSAPAAAAERGSAATRRASRSRSRPRPKPARRGVASASASGRRPRPPAQVEPGDEALAQAVKVAEHDVGGDRHVGRKSTPTVIDGRLSLVNRNTVRSRRGSARGFGHQSGREPRFVDSSRRPSQPRASAVACMISNAAAGEPHSSIRWMASRQLRRLSLLPAADHSLVGVAAQVAQLVATAGDHHQERQAAREPHRQRQELASQGDAQQHGAA